MTFRTCSFEREVLQELKDGHWPDGCPPELRAHVGNCAGCSDLVLVMQTFQRARRESVEDATEGSPGLIWWRAQLRRRNAAEQSIRKPITVAQVFAWAVTLIVLALFAAAQLPHAHWTLRAPTLTASYFSHLLPPTKVAWNLLLLIPGLGLLALFSGVVLYLVSEKQ